MKLVSRKLPKFFRIFKAVIQVLKRLGGKLKRRYSDTIADGDFEYTEGPVSAIASEYRLLSDPITYIHT